MVRTIQLVPYQKVLEAMECNWSTNVIFSLNSIMVWKKNIFIISDDWGVIYRYFSFTNISISKRYRAVQSSKVT